MDQQELIDKAHRIRENDGVSSETLTFALEPLTDQGIKLLLQQRPDLAGLFLMRTKITDACIEDLRQFPKLKEIDVSQTKITADGMAKLVEFVPMPEWRVDAMHINLTFAQAVSKQPWIHSVEVWGYPKDATRHEPNYDPHCLAFAESKSLRSIVFRSLPINGDCIDAVSQMNLFEFGITNSKCPAAPMHALANCSGLSSLNLSGTYANDALLDSLLDSLRLDTLFLANTLITDRTIEKILETQNLKALSLEMCDVSDDMVIRLAKMKSLKYIEFWNENAREGLDGEFQEAFGAEIQID